jgi:dTDP-4-dehydrorhamnose 3,5-epimerase-like enzyme
MENFKDTAHLINLPKIEDPRGNLTFIEEENHIQFQIKRVYWIYDVPGGEQRGGHAFKEQREFVVALCGSFDVVINNGKIKDHYHLNRSYYGLYIPSGLWRHMENFSTNAVVMVLSSTFYNEMDYIRNFNDYLLYVADE